MYDRTICWKPTNSCVCCVAFKEVFWHNSSREEVNRMTLSNNGCPENTGHVPPASLFVNVITATSPHFPSISPKLNCDVVFQREALFSLCSLIFTNLVAEVQWLFSRWFLQPSVGWGGADYWHAATAADLGYPTSDMEADARPISCSTTFHVHFSSPSHAPA